MSDKPKFTIKQRGYDRFSVDNYIDELEHQLQFTSSKLDVYRNQLDFLTEQLEKSQDNNLDLINRIRVLEIENEQLTALNSSITSKATEINDELSRAQESADQIILESLLIAQEILEALNETAYTTKDIRMELLDDLYQITQSVIDMDTEEPLVIDWFKKRK